MRRGAAPAKKKKYPQNYPASAQKPPARQGGRGAAQARSGPFCAVLAACGPSMRPVLPCSPPSRKARRRGAVLRFWVGWLGLFCSRSAPRLFPPTPSARPNGGAVRWFCSLGSAILFPRRASRLIVTRRFRTSRARWLGLGRPTAHRGPKQAQQRPRRAQNRQVWPVHPLPPPTAPPLAPILCRGEQTEEAHPRRRACRYCRPCRKRGWGDGPRLGGHRRHIRHKTHHAIDDTQDISLSRHSLSLLPFGVQGACCRCRVWWCVWLRGVSFLSSVSFDD